ncbi:DUF1707 SHOCT-like domain-containing protein [Sciscionella marina]|uniref:DUF1707 SHOCT-like domain-containing protein n=1 Tax=Sciscionella marina TaxID=508770 RepID=UPI00036BF62C|nr:DUF1707 domain-containing protein [Sciscionella marina]
MSTIPRIPPGQVRATDADRAATAAFLEQAADRGSLTLSEFAERTGAAYVARTRGELQALTVDLPEEPMPERFQAPNRALRRSARFQDLRVLTSCWLLGSLLLLAGWGALSAVAGEFAGWWPLWAIGPSGAVLATGWWLASR